MPKSNPIGVRPTTMAQELPMYAARFMGFDRVSFLGCCLGLAAAMASPRATAQTTAPVAADTSAEAPPTPQAARTMSLPEAIAYARAHQPAIRAALSRVSERMAEARVPSGQWLPTIGVTAQLYGMTANNTTATYVGTAFMDIPRIGATQSTTSSAASLAPFASTLVGAGVTQELFDFGRIGAQRAAADELVNVEKHRADVELLDIGFGVEEAYFAVFAAKAIVRASDEAYDRSKVHRDLAKRGVDS